MMVGILGFAQTGKDTISDLLAEAGFIRVAFADPLKRITRTLFDFTYEQMWGTLQQKEAPDERYPREHTWSERIEHNTRRMCLCCGRVAILDRRGFMPEEDFGQCYLNGRYALKIIGTEGARHCYDSIWSDQTIRAARAILDGWSYSREHGVMGLSLTAPQGVIFTDCRFENEVKSIRDAGGKVYRLRRPGYDEPRFDHASEVEQTRIPDYALDGTIHNDGTLEDLKRKVRELLGLPSGGIMATHP